jgi:hypothetical protein
VSELDWFTKGSNGGSCEEDNELLDSIIGGVIFFFFFCLDGRLSVPQKRICFMKLIYFDMILRRKIYI